MEYVYAALLLHSAKKEINKDNVASVLKAAGVAVNDAKVEALVSALEGVSIDEALKNAAASMMVAAPAPAAPQAAAKEAPKEEKDEKKEEEAAAGLASLFG